MTAGVQTSLLTPVVRRLPHWLVAVLDDWSYRIAKRRAQRRREAALRRMAAAPRAQARA